MNNSYEGIGVHSEEGKNYLKYVDYDRNKFFKAWTRGVPFEDQAIRQAMNVATLPFVDGVAVMPDGHAGIGATVGSVIAMRGAVCPSIVGVDIGCGMRLAKLPFNINRDSVINDPEVRRKIRLSIQAHIPHGRTDPWKGADVGSWCGMPPGAVLQTWDSDLYDTYCEWAERFPQVMHDFAVAQLGTLGTGNHFIEISVDETGDVWAVIHSGSRGPGNKIGSQFIKIAQNLMKKYFIKLVDPALAYLPEGTPEFDGYWALAGWAQKYAKINRQLMMENLFLSIEEATGIDIGTIWDHEGFDCHHNYVTREFFPGKGNLLISRKGAIQARKGTLGFIPGARGAESFIVEGLGNEESYCSGSHGAGRVMSRTQAKKLITMEQDERDCAGIECNRGVGLLDESKAAYKNVADVMAAQADLVKPIHTLHQIINVKGEGDKDA